MRFEGDCYSYHMSYMDILCPDSIPYPYMLFVVKNRPQTWFLQERHSRISGCQVQICMRNMTVSVTVQASIGYDTQAGD